MLNVITILIHQKLRMCKRKGGNLNKGQCVSQFHGEMKFNDKKKEMKLLENNAKDVNIFVPCQFGREYIINNEKVDFFILCFLIGSKVKEFKRF